MGFIFMLENAHKRIYKAFDATKSQEKSKALIVAENTIPPLRFCPQKSSRAKSGVNGSMYIIGIKANRLS